MAAVFLTAATTQRKFRECDCNYVKNRCNYPNSSLKKDTTAYLASYVCIILDI